MSICYKCFKEFDGNGPCSYCGFDIAEQENKYPHALKPGTIVGGQYIIGRVLGQGGFGITYSAQDYNKKQIVAIKEYLPEQFAARASKNQISLYSAKHENDFLYGKENFLAEAKTLSQFNGQANICDIYSYFEENGTAYFSMEYVEGVSLGDYMKTKGGRLSFEEAKHLLIPVMRALDNIHSKGIIHRDIAPDNIMVKADGSVMLIDFGAARYSMGEKSRSLDVILKHGFAPKEQYTRHGRQGAYTDVYAVAATFYYAITGKVPPEAIDRIGDEDLVLPSSVGVKISEEEETALLRALEVSPEKRYQSMNDFIRELTLVPGNVNIAAKTTPENREYPSMAKAKIVNWKTMAVCAAAIVVVVSAAFLLKGANTPAEDSVNSPPRPATTTTTSYEVNIDGKTYYADSQEEIDDIINQSIYGASFFGDTAADPKLASGDIQIEPVSGKLNGDIIEYTLKIKNVSKHKFTYLDIFCSLLDANGDIVGNTIIHVNSTLASGKTITLSEEVYDADPSVATIVPDYVYYDTNGDYNVATYYFPEMSAENFAIHLSSSQDSKALENQKDGKEEADPGQKEDLSYTPAIGEKNALKAAKNYLSVMPFSYNGLVKQLEYEQYSHEEAVYGVDNCGADWNKQALKAAKNYLSVMPFSYDGLVEQLGYEGYTNEQAVYGADNCGADWDEQAVKAAKNYSDVMAFSRDGLIQQLQYEGYTYEQAVYGVEANGY